MGVTQRARVPSATPSSPHLQHEGEPAGSRAGGPENAFLLGTAGPRLGGAKMKARLTWAASEQGSWQCSMSGTQAFLTSSLKKCLLETLTTLASFPKRRKALTRSSSLSCSRDTQTCSETRGAGSPTRPRLFSADPLENALHPCKAFWVIPSGRSPSLLQGSRTGRSSGICDLYMLDED